MDDTVNAATPAAESGSDVRPVVHFTPPRGWLSDPNGLVSVDGRHHLFYQHHPAGTTWGEMHWGHAVSPDFVTWQHLPVALVPDDSGLIYSGSAVRDGADTAGFGRGAMVAMFTYHVDAGESQALAWSTDGGHTFVKFAANPVIPAHPDRPMCRDPKVFWYGEARSGHWVMTLAATTEIWIYTSDNLRDWTHTDSVGGFEHGEGSLETPDLFELDADDGTRKWVLTAGIMHGAPAGGTGTAMLVGHFDGHRFIHNGGARWVDHGAHFYAAQSWNDVDDRRVWIAWMGNWRDPVRVRTRAWHGQMSIPRELALRATDSDYRLQQTPVREIAYLRQPGIDQQSVVVTELGHQPEVSGRALDVTIDLAAARPGGLQVIARRGDDAIAVEIDPTAGEVTVDLPPAVVEPGPDGALLRRADLVPGDVQLHIILDVASIEVMGGAASITDVLVLDQTPWELTLVATDGERTIERLRVHPLDSAGADAQRPVDPEGALTWQP